MRLPLAEHFRALFRAERPLLALFAFTSLGRTACSMAALFLIQEFLGAALGQRGGLAATLAQEGGPGAVLGAVALLLLAAYLGAATLNYLNQISQMRIVKVVELGTMERLIRHLLTLSVPYIERQSHGDMAQAVRQDVGQLRLAVISAASLLVEGILTVGIVAAMFRISPRIAMLGLLILPLAALPMILKARATLARARTARRTGYVLLDIVLDILRGIRAIKAYAGEEAEARLSVEKGSQFFDEQIEITRLRAGAQLAFDVLAGLGIVVAVVAGGIEVMRGRLAWPSLLAFVVALRALHAAINNVNGHWFSLSGTAAHVQRLVQLLDVRPQVVDRPDAKPLREAPQRIALEGVSFSYGDAPVLCDVGFEVRKGETIGIVGPSGAGKTTLLNVIARFYDPVSGRVLFDGRDLKDLRSADVYAQLAIVTQEPFLFATTVRENIRFGRPAATDAEVEAAARAASIHEDLLALPRGYDTPIGVGGRGLSSGQAQRVSVARALLKNAPILLLDEATASLDSVAEVEVQRSIDRLMLGRTSFVVAHRLSTLRDADRILVLDRGRIVGMGTHEELLRECPTYRGLRETQRVADPSLDAAPQSTNAR